jgi:ketosteroid isomerase-like protein
VRQTKRWLLLIVMTLLQLNQTSAQAKTEAEILELSTEKFRWKTARQIDRVADLFDDEIIFVHLNGHISSKKEWIDQLRSGRFIYNVIKVKEASAKSYGDTTVLVGKAEFTVTMGGSKSKYDLVYTEVYAKKADSWKLVNLHTCGY